MSTTTLLSVILEQSKYAGGVNEQIEFFNKYNQIHLEESDDLVRRKIRKILSQEFELERMGSFLKKIKDLEAQNAILLKEKQAFKKNNSHIFITINPSPSVELADFMKVCHKVAKKTCFSDILYVFEQRGTTANCDIGKGFHCHLLCTRNLNYKPAKCITNMKQSLKKFVGNVNNQAQLNFQVCGKEYARDKKDYILGKNKKGDGKDEKQLGDDVWRAKNLISAFYGSENII